MKDIKFKGWIGKSCELNQIMIYRDGFGKIELEPIFDTKGPKKYWVKEDWPPKQIEIIIREISNDCIDVKNK